MWSRYTSFVTLILSITILDPALACPKGCVCFDRTIRCMHLRMEAVPFVPPDTVMLDLRFNKIRDIPPGAFSSAKTLTTILLNNNQLTMLRGRTFEGLKKLKYLYLYKNLIHHIDDEAFKGLSALSHLYLHFNKLENINKEVFSHLPSLDRLFLQHNNIQKLPDGTFEGMKNLKRLRLDSNALICDCSLLWLLKMINEERNKGTLQTTAVCQNPETFRGQPLQSMEPIGLHCVKPYIETGPEDIEVTFGGSAIFECKVAGDPVPEIYWMRNSNEIPWSDPRYTVLKNGSLKIDNPDESDQGVFECMAKSPLGEVKSNIARMNFKRETNFNVSPEFSKIPESKTVGAEEKSVSLHCHARGHPQPHILWYHNDHKVILNENIKLYRNGTLSIRNTDFSNSGSYRCEAENIYGKVFATAHLKFLSPPIISISTSQSEYNEGIEFEIICLAQGTPPPLIVWFKDHATIQSSPRVIVENHKIHIVTLKEKDSGIYMCLAENSEGFKEENIEIKVIPMSKNPPEILIKPYDIEAIPGSKIELPCIANSSEGLIVAWKKDGSNLLKTDRHKVSLRGNLYITNVTESDGGRYECSLTNSYGRATASGLVTILEEMIQKPGNQFVKIAFAEAVKEIDLAINNTIENLFGKKDARPSMSELYRIVRFPNAPERQLARAAEVYERTLVNIRHLVNAGKKVNITSDFNYKELLSPDHINLVAKLSGCMAHRNYNNCSDHCYHSNYRTLDGTCNNIQHPTWGASNTGFRRILQPIYENGFSQPVGWEKGLKYNGYELPSARLVSMQLISTAEVTSDKRITHMVMQWGQFLDHDMDHATPSVSSQSWDGIDCKRSCNYAAPCFPIDIPKSDQRVNDRRCIDFVRSSSVCGSGMTSVFFDEIQPREQINQLTSFIDASQVYGYSDNVANDLRNLSSDLGLLREGITYPGKKPLLPFSSSVQEMDCRKGALDSDIMCFVAGDIRANEQVGLLAMHTIWFREHNRLARELKEINPHWNGQKIYNEARKLVGAEVQHITYHDWLPLILGPSGIDKLNSKYKGYDPNVNPTIANVFATAALRFGHSLINPILERLNENFAEIPEGHLPLHKAFFASWRVAEEGGVDPLIRGLFMSPAKLKTPSQNLNSDLTEKLFHVAHAVALDLAAMNIQRSRDHAIPFYTEWRKYCNMSNVDSFDDLKNEITDDEVRNKLKEVYGSVNNIDVWVGGILEDQVEGGKVGPLFQCLLVEQFHNLRAGDRLWYEDPDVFTPDQLGQIKNTKLSRVICDNSDNLDYVSLDVFILPDQNEMLDCLDVPSMDLRFWMDCKKCSSCSQSRHSREVENMEFRQEIAKLKEDLKIMMEELRSLTNN